MDDGNWLFRDVLLGKEVKIEKWMLDEVDRLIKKLSKKKDSKYFETYFI
jgi:zinc transporter 9